MPSANSPTGLIDVDLIRMAARNGWVDPARAEDSLRRCADGTAALADLIASGALDRKRLASMRAELVAHDEPRALGGYRICEAIGWGGMGVVYRAIDADGEEVAIKVLSAELAADPQVQRRFRREAEATSAIRHPHVVACRGMDIDQGRLFMVMELVGAGNAEELVERHGGGLSANLAAAICRDAAAGLEAVHAAGLIHRDVKPANLLLTRDGRAKLGDFSIVCARHGIMESLTSVGRVIGTLGYMAPEQLVLKAKIDARADLYALGATLFFLLTGRAPFVGDDQAALVAQIATRPLPDPRTVRSDCSGPLAMVVRGAGALRPDERYQGAREMRLDLERALLGREPMHAPASADGTTVVVRRHPPTAKADAGIAAPPTPPTWPTAGLVDDGPARRAAAAIVALAGGWRDAAPGVAVDLAEVARAAPPLTAWADACGSPFTSALIGSCVALSAQLGACGDQANPSSLRTLAAGFVRVRELVERRYAGPDLASLAVLVVDDDLVSRKAMAQALHKVGIRVDVCASAAEALTMLSGDDAYALVLSDVLMGGVNGFQFAAKVRADPRYRQLPIVFVTSLRDFDQVFSAGDAGLNDAIAKPFLVKELTVKALTLLAPRRAET